MFGTSHANVTRLSSQKRHSKHPVYAHRRLPLPWLLEHFSGPIIQVGSVQQGLWILPVCLLAISLGKYLLRSRYDIRIFHPQCYSYLRLYLEFKETQKKTCHRFFFVSIANMKIILDLKTKKNKVSAASRPVLHSFAKLTHLRSALVAAGDL